MKPNESWNDEALRSLMESLPMSPNTPENLRSKLIDLAASPAARHRAVRRPLFVLATGAVTVMVAVALVTSLPATAKSWEGIKKAAQAIRSMDLTVTDSETGVIRTRAHVDSEVISVQLREGDALYVNDHMLRTFDKSANLVFDVTLSKNGKQVDLRGMVLKELSMANILNQYEAEYGRENIMVGEVRESKGSKVYDVVLRDGKTPAYGNLVVDAATDLPISIQVFVPRDGKITKVMEMSTRFNQVLKVVPPFPKGAKHESIEIGKFIEKNGGVLPKLNFSVRRLFHG